MIKNQLEKILGFGVEATENPEFGDYSSNIAMVEYRKLAIATESHVPGGKKQGIIWASKPGKMWNNPREYAEDLITGFKTNKELKKFVEKIEVAGPGFINFWLTRSNLVNELGKIEKEGQRYGSSDLFKGQKVMFEYAHPNTHKAFHIGHLRNITTGETLARLFEANGAKVIRVNYQGDVGLHIAKALWGINKLGFTDPGEVKARAEFLGKAYSEGAKAYEEDEKAKKEIDDINGKIYDKSDEELSKLYKETRQWSLDYFDEIYKRVYTKFDRLYFESEVAGTGKEIAKDALKKGILKESEGAVIFPGSEYGLHDRVFISGKGVPTYEAKDLGLAQLQFAEYNPDKLIHTVGPEQTAYFQVIFKAIKLILPEIGDREVHVPYGWVRLKEGKMSSRTGNVVLGEWLLDEAKSSIKKSFDTEEKTAEAIAVGAVKYSFLKTGLTQDIAFDLKESISLEGNSGPYLQYTAARCNSVLAKTQNKRMSEYVNKMKNGKWKVENEEELVLRSLSRFSEVIATAAKTYSPNLLCNFLYDLAQKYNSFYNKYRILPSDSTPGVEQPQKTEFRVTLTFGVGQVLKNGLKLLGIQAPERM